MRESAVNEDFQVIPVHNTIPLFIDSDQPLISMKITPDLNRHATLIRSYGDGHVVIVSPSEEKHQETPLTMDNDPYEGFNIEKIDENIVVTPETLVRNLLPATPAELGQHHMDHLGEHRPELIIFGTGEKIVFPDQRLTVSLWQKGIGIEVMDTAAACRTYNYLIADDRRVVAALFMI